MEESLVFGGRGGLGFGWESHMAAGGKGGVGVGVARLSVLHSLKGLGLGRDHEGRRCGPRHVPGGEFGRAGGFGGLGGHHRGVGWGGLGEARRLSVLLERRHGGLAGAGPALGAVVDHGLGGGGARAGAAGAG